MHVLKPNNPSTSQAVALRTCLQEMILSFQHCAVQHLTHAWFELAMSPLSSFA